MVKPITLFTSSAGLNTKLDPQRLMAGYDNETGISEFAQAVNVSIDDRGLVTLRNGFSQETTGEFHSLFCDGGDCFVVQEGTNSAALMKVNADLTLTGVRSGLTKNRRMAWGQSNYDTFYSNGLQNGFVRDGVSYTWPVGTYQGPDVDMQFTAAPIADRIAFMAGGQILLAKGDALFLNHEPFQYGLFNLRKGYIGFASPVRMVCPVTEGFFVSDGSNTWFFRRTESWYAYRQELADDVPVIEGSLTSDRVRLSDIGFEGDGFGRIWCSTEGVCLGTDSGRVVNLTKDAVVYPTGYTYGACLLRGTTVINTTL